MPKILNQPLIKTLAEIEVGELFRMPFHNSSALCITLNADKKKRLLGVISSPDVGHPFYFEESKAAISCASYGREWLIDPEVGEESFVQPHFFLDQIGMLHSGTEDIWMRFDPLKGINESDSKHYSLFGRGVVDRRAKAVSYRQWSIWQSEDNRNFRHGQPLARIVGRSATPDA